MENEGIGQKDHLGRELHVGDCCIHVSRYSSSVRGRRCVVEGDVKRGVRVVWMDGGRETGVVAPYNLVRVAGF